MKKKQIFVIALVLILLCSISVMGTLAFLTAQQDGQKAVVNTFVAAGGGNIIEDDDDDPTAPTIPGEPPIELQNGFYLVESKAKYEKPNYVLETDKKVLTNLYNKVVPSMSIPKDPKLTVNLVEEIDAYIFVKITDTTAGNLTYTPAAGWMELTVSGLGANEKLYLYNNTIITGVAAVDLNAVSILNGDKVTAAANLTDADTSTEGMQLGALEFEAYVCQAGGFADAAEAFTKCFMGSNG